MGGKWRVSGGVLFVWEFLAAVIGAYVVVGVFDFVGSSEPAAGESSSIICQAAAGNSASTRGRRQRIYLCICIYIYIYISQQPIPTHPSLTPTHEQKSNRQAAARPQEVHGVPRRGSGPLAPRAREAQPPGTLLLLFGLYVYIIQVGGRVFGCVWLDRSMKVHVM